MKIVTETRKMATFTGKEAVELLSEHVARRFNCAMADLTTSEKSYPAVTFTLTKKAEG